MILAIQTPRECGHGPRYPNRTNFAAVEAHRRTATDLDDRERCLKSVISLINAGGRFLTTRSRRPGRAAVPQAPCPTRDTRLAFNWAQSEPVENAVLNQAETVLVVEADDEDFAVLLDAWRRAKVTHYLHRCSTAAEAVAFLKKASPDKMRPPVCAAIVETSLPDAQGDGAIRQICGLFSAAALPVIVYSAQGQPEVIRDCYDAGAISFVAKGDDAEAFVEAFSRWWLQTVILNEAKLDESADA